MSVDGTYREGNGRRRSRKIKMIVRRSIDNLRQLMHPGPFRIKESPDLVTVSKDVLLDKGAAPDAKPTGENADPDYTQLLKTVAAVATALWRVRTKLEGPASAELPSELRHVPRHVQAAWDALASGHIEVQDHRGQRYVPGMAVRPVTYSPDPSLPPNTIIEALRPSIFYRDVLIQRAHVILAAPPDVPAREAQPDQTNTRPSDADPECQEEDQAGEQGS